MSSKQETTDPLNFNFIGLAGTLSSVIKVRLYNRVNILSLLDLHNFNSHICQITTCARSVAQTLLTSHS